MIFTNPITNPITYNEDVANAAAMLQKHIREAIGDRDNLITVKPTQLIVQPTMFMLARRILFPHHILKRRKGARGRAMTLKWRRK
jgi:hypothetical protein